MYKVWAKETFSAAHFLNEYDGDCSNIHGHNWTVIVTVDTQGTLDNIGISIDMKDLKQDLKSILSPLDHAFLTNSSMKVKVKDYTYKSAVFDPNPTAEVISKWVYNSLAKLGYRVNKVEILEGSNSGVVFYN